MTRHDSPENGNGNGSKITIQLLFWVLGALMTLVGLFSGIAHSLMMHQLDGIEHRIERIENREMGPGTVAGKAR